jgi:RNA polymerase sigma-70 factor, ECF subfamily
MDTHHHEAGPADAALVRRTLAGETSAFNELVRRYQKCVHSLIYRIVANEDDAADLLQETFVRAYRALNSFRQDASFVTWLYRIASNLSIDLIRSRKTRGSLSLDFEIAEGREPAADESCSPEDVLVRGEVSDHVHRAVMGLPDRYRIVIVMRHLQGLRINEIAEALQIPVGTVKTHLYRARELLRQRLGPVLEMEANGTTSDV